MKLAEKRLFALILTLAVCLSLLPADLTAYAATVNYVYAGTVIKNWGTRGETATFLSPNAETFYAQNGVSYSSLSALSGATSTSAVPDSDLYDALHTLMYENVKNSYTSYDATKDLFQYTDCQNSGKTSNKISSFYSGAAIGPSWDSGKTWNREHVWPNSKSNGGSNTNTRRETDIMMLRPASVSENSGRSNTAYGESSKFYDPNEASGGVYDLRGDVARIVLYIYTCWGGSEYHDGALDYMWGSSGVIESKEILLKWMEEDPVDTWELGRNDSVESVTGTRNVYVDFPELAFLLFNEDVPTGYTSPSGGAMESYTVTGVSSNTAWGTVSVSGYTVTATPNTGYEVTGFQLLSGTAQVNRSGNIFTVTPTSDVEIQINFAPRTTRTVHFTQLGAVVHTATVYAGDATTLPGHTGQLPADYSFLGWVENTLDKTQTRPVFYKAGDRFTPTADITLHALYSQTESGGADSDTFEPYTGALTEGDYLIVYDDCAMLAAETSGKRLQYAAVTYTDGNVENPAEDMIWHIAPAKTGWTMYNETTGKYAGGNGTRNQAALLDSVTNYAMWTETVKEGTYEFINVGNDADGVNPLLRKNQTYGFACYATNTNVGGSLSLYKRASGPVWYFTGQRRVADQNGNAYETLAAALQNVAAGSKLTLLQDVQEDVTISKNITLELDGLCVDGTVTVADGCTLLGTDCQTDDYIVQDTSGYGTIARVVCQGSGKAAAGEGYMQVTEADGTSYHRVDLSLTAMTLRATVAGVYYKSSFAGDEVAARHIDSFGVALSIVGVPTSQTIKVNGGYSVFTGFKPGSNSSAATSTLLKNIMRTTNSDEKNQTNANTVIYGNAYILTDEGEYLFGAAQERTLRQQVEGADALWSVLSDSQKASLQEMYATYKAVMEAWNVPNLKGSVEVTPPEPPVQTSYVRVTSADQLTDGQYVMIVSTGYAPGVYADGWLTAVQPVVEDDKVTDTAGAVWTLDFEDGLVAITDANGVTIKPKGTATNGIASGSYQWNCSFKDGVAKFTGTGNYAITLASNTTAQGLNRFRGYKTSTVTGSPNNYPCQFTLYKLIEN